MYVLSSSPSHPQTRTREHANAATLRLKVKVKLTRASHPAPAWRTSRLRLSAWAAGSCHCCTNARGRALPMGARATTRLALPIPPTYTAIRRYDNEVREISASRENAKTGHTSRRARQAKRQSTRATTRQSVKASNSTASELLNKTHVLTCLSPSHHGT